MKQNSNSNQKNIQVFTTVDRRILDLSPQQNREEVFEQINSMRIIKDNLVFRKNAKDRSKLKWLKRNLKPMLGQKFSNALV